MPNIASILDRPGSEIVRIPPLPTGTYRTIIQGLPRYDKTTKKQTDFVEFKHLVIEAMDDVDIEELEAAGGITGKVIENVYYLTEKSALRLKLFLEDCGFNFETDDVTLREAAENTGNCEVFIKIKHEASNDGTGVFARIEGTAAAS